MSTHHGPVVVVGGGGAAASLIRELYRNGVQRLHLVTAEERLPYDRTTVSKGLLTGDLADAPPLFPELFDTDGGPVVHRGATVQEIDRRARTIRWGDGATLEWERLVLATGAAPKLPPVAGLDLPGVSVLRSAAHGHRLAAQLGPGRRLVVVGGGVIGLEVAAAARARGTAVVVLEAAPRPMARVLPPAVVDPLLAVHRGAGVELRTEVLPEMVEGADGQLLVLCADGTTALGDHVLVAVGVAPRTALAEAAGLTVDDGVVVGPLLTTDDPGILAIGDVARVVDPEAGTSTRTEAWTPALAMGQHAARTLLGDPTPYREVPWSWSDQYDLRVQAAGWPDLATSWVVRGRPGDLEAGVYAFGQDPDDRVRAVAGVSRGRAVGRVVRAGQQLVAKGVVVLAETLADPAVDLRRLGRAAT